MWLSRNKRNNTNGWLYTLEVTKAIPITKLIDQIIIHPTDDDDVDKYKRSLYSS